jgi:hypothetical protein
MVYERWPQQFKIDEICQFLQKEVFPLEPIHQAKSFGGWSILSSNGDYRDGWHQGHHLYRADLDVGKVRQKLRESAVKNESEYVVPTRLCSGPIKELIDFVAYSRLEPSRARIIRLTPGMSCSWHMDAPIDQYAVRLHVPLITNSGCFFETETERAHLPADGAAYFLFVNRLHRVINEGSSFRYHLVMDVRDSNQVSKFHRLEDFSGRAIKSTT